MYISGSKCFDLFTVKSPALSVCLGADSVLRYKDKKMQIHSVLLQNKQKYVYI